MHLYLTKWSHLNSSYVNDDGQVLYKVETPNKFFNRVATIKRIVPGSIIDPPPSTSGRGVPPQYEFVNDNDVKGDDVEYDKVPDEHVDEKDDIREELNDDDLALKDRFSHLAEIKFHDFTSSILRFGGHEQQTSHFFTSKGFGYYGHNRVFTGPDGLEYQWSLGIRVPELVRLDSVKTPIARFHRRRLGVLKKRRPASLEIFPEGTHMVDLILITFVYIQKIRNDAEQTA
ncbi:hypothetical protein JOM56_010348 [Amanita muscaria]